MKKIRLMLYKQIYKHYTLFVIGMDIFTGVLLMQDLKIFLNLQQLLFVCFFVCFLNLEE